MNETDHDMLIEIRTDVKHLIEKHEELRVDFGCLEDRIRSIEISGSHEAEEAIKRCEMVETKLLSLEKNGAMRKGEQSLWNNIWVRGGILASIVLGVLAFINDFRKGLF